MVGIGDRCWPARHVDMGNPHAVVCVDDLAEAGPLLEPPVHDAAVFPYGVNVEFVVRRGDRHIAMRVHERGSGETRSCGTGACAAMVGTALADGRSPSDDLAYRVDLPGGTLTVTWTADDQVLLTGPAARAPALSNTEVQRLREYLLKGGFLWVDDFWGTRAWDQWAGLITRVLPEFPIVDVAPADPIRHALFNITEVKQVPSIFAWGGPGSDPRERGSDSPHANFRAIADGHGRIMVAMTHNTDIGDSMEREGDDPAYFAAFSPDGYALATNIVLYALTH